MTPVKCTMCGYTTVVDDYDPRVVIDCSILLKDYADTCGYSAHGSRYPGVSKRRRGYMVPVVADQDHLDALVSAYRLGGYEALRPWWVPPEQEGESYADAIDRVRGAAEREGARCNQRLTWVIVARKVHVHDVADQEREDGPAVTTHMTYICTAGHVDAQPSMGSFDCCQWLVPVAGTGGRGRAPCGCRIVSVPHDPVIESAFAMGGTDAVHAVLVERNAPRA